MYVSYALAKFELSVLVTLGAGFCFINSKVDYVMIFI